MTRPTGRCDDAFSRVRDAFEENFASRGEVGAAVSVRVDGVEVVDLFGGLADSKTGRAWTPDTVVMMFSATKGATSALLHLLASRGALSLDEPIAKVWPAFGQAGKEGVTTRMVLSHRAGLPAIDEPLPVEAAYDQPRMADALARQAPHWLPGTAHGYHPFTFGWLLAEVVRRACGATLGTSFAREIAGPLELSCWIGLPEEEEPRVARLLPPKLPITETPMVRAMFDRATLTARSFLNPMTFYARGEVNSRAMRAAEIPSVNGVSDARSLARLYEGMLSGALFSRETLEQATAPVSEGVDRVLLHDTRFSAGFMRSMRGDGVASFVLGPTDAGFGHVGAGGSFGLADPAARVAIGYVMNQMGEGTLLNERGQALIDAVYASL